LIYIDSVTGEASEGKPNILCFNTPFFYINWRLDKPDSLISIKDHFIRIGRLGIGTMFTLDIE